VLGYTTPEGFAARYEEERIRKAACPLQFLGIKNVLTNEV